MKKPTNPLYEVFMAHPELNASAIARRLGISQSLFAQYVSGTKKPSAERMEAIFETIRSVVENYAPFLWLDVSNKILCKRDSTRFRAFFGSPSMNKSKSDSYTEMP